MKNGFVRKINWFWQNAEKLLIILFLATFTLNIRKVFLTPYSFLNGAFNEYLTISLSWADALMIAVIIIYTIKYIISQLKKVKYDKVIQNDNKATMSSSLGLLQSVSRETFLLLLCLLWVGLSVFWSQYRPIAAYRFTTLLEITFFALLATKMLADQRWFNMALFAVIINGLFQSALGIAQFIHNGSLGLRYLGESIIGPNVDGVAKIVVSGEKHVRAYGTFQHPNILAGFLIIPIFIVLSELLERRVNKKHIQDEVSRGTIIGIIQTWLLIMAFVIMAIAFILTFSRSAFLGLFIGILFLSAKFRRNISKQLIFSAGLIALIVILGACYALYSERNIFSLFSTQSLQERTFYQNVSRETISSQPVVGVGIGQFVLDEYQRYPSLEGWQYQPVHNIYLLIFSELGIIGFFLFAALLLTIILKDRGTGKILDLTLLPFCCIVISYLIIALFDHYFWDIKTGLIIFTIALALYQMPAKKQA